MDRFGAIAALALVLVVLVVLGLAAWAFLRPRPPALRVVAVAHRIHLTPSTTGDPRAVTVFVVSPPPARHHNLFAAGPWHPPGDDSGFLLSDGSFATRKRAAEVAIAAGQVRPERMTVPGVLYSEDVW